MQKLIFFIFLFFTINSYAIEIKAVSDVWAPYIISMEKGEGYLVEILNYIAKREGFTFQGKTKPFTESKDLVYSGKADVLVGCTDNDNVGMRVIKISLAKLQYGFFEKSKNASKWEYKGVDSLKSKKLGVTKGYSFGPLDDYVTSGKNVKQFETKTPLYDLIKAVEGNQIDILLQDINVTAFTLKSKFKNLELRPSGLLSSSNDIYLCVSEDSKNSMYISDVIERNLEEMLKDGTIAKLKEKYSIKL